MDYFTVQPRMFWFGEGFDAPSAEHFVLCLFACALSLLGSLPAAAAVCAIGRSFRQLCLSAGFLTRCPFLYCLLLLVLLPACAATAAASGHAVGRSFCSCSEDGTVVITGLQPGPNGEQTPPEVYSYGAKWPMLAVNLDPLYARRWGLLSTY